MNWKDRPSSFRERKASVNAVHSENGKLEHTHTFAYPWVSHRGSCIALHQQTSFIVKRVPFICHLHASLQDVSGEHETCLVIIRHVSWLQDKGRLKEMYSPCQLRIRPAFHTEQGKIAPHINFSVCCQQGILLQNKLYQFTPELSLQISVLALLSSQNRPRSWFPRTMSPNQLKWTVSAYSRAQPPVRRVRIHRVYLIEASYSRGKGWKC